MPKMIPPAHAPPHGQPFRQSHQGRDGGESAERAQKVRQKVDRQLEEEVPVQTTRVQLLSVRIDSVERHERHLAMRLCLVAQGPDAFAGQRMRRSGASQTVPHGLYRSNRNTFSMLRTPAYAAACGAA